MKKILFIVVLLALLAAYLPCYGDVSYDQCVDYTINYIEQQSVIDDCRYYGHIRSPLSDETDNFYYDKCMKDVENNCILCCQDEECRENWLGAILTDGVKDEVSSDEDKVKEHGCFINSL